VSRCEFSWFDILGSGDRINMYEDLIGRLQEIWFHTLNHVGDPKSLDIQETRLEVEIITRVRRGVG
jgi:hypothetical protein